MESYNPTSHSNSQSNIVPFDSASFNLGRAAQSNAPAQISAWERFWDKVLDFLAPSSEPRITQKQKPNGNEYYQVYDPITGSSKTFGSELETRIWLDRRFY